MSCESALTCSLWAWMVCSLSCSLRLISCCSRWLLSWWSDTDDCIRLSSFSSWETAEEKRLLFFNLQNLNMKLVRYKKQEECL